MPKGVNSTDTAQDNIDAATPTPLWNERYAIGEALGIERGLSREIVCGSSVGVDSCEDQVDDDTLATVGCRISPMVGAEVPSVE